MAGLSKPSGGSLDGCCSGYALFKAKRRTGVCEKSGGKSVCRCRWFGLALCLFKPAFERIFPQTR